jgi:hypothetical protein
MYLDLKPYSYYDVMNKEQRLNSDTKDDQEDEDLPVD